MQNNRRQSIGVWAAVGIAVGIAVGTAAGLGADGIFPWIIGGALFGALVGAGILNRHSPDSLQVHGNHTTAPLSMAEQNQSKGRSKISPPDVMRHAALRVVPVVHRKGPRCFV